jgi:hypothetical protein
MIMQNHTKKWYNNTSSTNAMAAIAIGAMLVFSVAGMKAFADNVVNNVESSDDTVTITEGATTTVSYWIVANNAAGDVRGCNPTSDKPTTVTINTPAGVSANPSSLSFTDCGNGNSKSVEFSSETAGDYSITVDASGGQTGSQYNETPATFTLAVDAPTGGGGDTGGGGGGGETPPTDTTPPVITADVQGTKGDNDWYTSDVSVHWTVNDAESTVTSNSGCEDATIPETTPDGVTLTCKATSAGGTAEKSITIKKDSRAPEVSLVGGPADGSSYFYGFLPDKPTCTAEDPTPGSGLVGECTVGDYDKNAGAGSHTVTATAKDTAGNTGTDENAYTVKQWTHSGYYQPVDNPTTVNTVKGGSTVPFKFELSADSEFTSTTFNGNPIGAFSAKKTSCSGGTTDDIEVTATGGTSFRYDSTAGQFIYNWQTAKGAGQCYEVTFTDQSGGTLSALFRTK